MKTGSNKDINRDHETFPVAKPNVARHDPVGELKRSYNLRMLTEKQSDEKLATTVMIEGLGLLFIISGRVKINGSSIIYNRWCRGKFSSF